ncbi:MAG TPA: hypothetical protein VEF72_25860 [Mycobacterium sp.]|nr:hypothetical protein [Mycobacterium sp.]
MLSLDASQPTQHQVLGVPLIPSPAVAEGDVWGVPQARVLIVLRGDVTLDVDCSAYLSSDHVGVRATICAGFAFPRPAAIVRLHDTA